LFLENLRLIVNSSSKPQNSYGVNECEPRLEIFFLGSSFRAIARIYSGMQTNSRQKYLEVFYFQHSVVFCCSFYRYILFYGTQSKRSTAMCGIKFFISQTSKAKFVLFSWKGGLGENPFGFPLLLFFKKFFSEKVIHKKREEL
jgi:hypothetical protein